MVEKDHPAAKVICKASRFFLQIKGSHFADFRIYRRLWIELYKHS